MEAREDPVVSFMVAGAQKCGTTLLHDILARHPGTSPAEPKELHYFDRDENFEGLRSRDGYRGYHRHFSSPGDGSLRFESTPSYLFFRSAIARIHHYNPAMKLVLILRDPVERAYSQYRMRRRMEKEPAPTFAEAIQLEDDRMRSGSASNGSFAYVGRGMYAQQLLNVFRYFDESRVFVGLFDDFRRDPEALVGGLCRFLGLEGGLELGGEWKERPPEGLDPSTENALRKLFRREIEALEFLIGRDLTAWTEGKG